MEFFSFEEYKDKFTEKFEHGLLYTKGYLLVLLLFVTLYYQLENNSKFSKKIKNDVTGTATFFSTNSSLIKVVGAASVSGFIGALSVWYVLYWSRKDVKGILKAIALVFIILFMYDIAQESSGMNLYVNQDEILEGKGPYASLNDTDSSTLSQILQRNSSTGNPFIHAVGSAAITTSVLYVLYMVGMMIMATWYGAYVEDGRTSINKINFNGGLSPTTGFSIELFVMALNGLTPLISAYVRGEKLNSNVYKNSLMFLFGSLLIHVGAQYSGMYLPALESGSSSGTETTNE